ncbi:lipopolysaccharide biosynthesis protein [Pedobacter antarcticus]|uniref:lipopolysaccharide biosynthesis protein n=1 Tax=Pedobacter antarcticus TaxID=34086 RepID=UPI0008892222|nr:lipopolysaccharide biosynthesis protein [Pedobacter antarcticus]SDM17355.1 Membrane protein involved in the export of O-antigen and teichoic acid [Pedobacter antarcticus]
MSLVKQAKKSVVWTFIQQFSVQLINLGVQIILARLLLPSDFGLIAMITVFVALGQSLSDSGMTSSLVRNDRNTENDYGTVFITNVGISVLLFGLAYVLAPFVADFYRQEILTSLLRAYSLVFIISSFNVVQLAKFTKELNFKSQFIYQLPSVIISAGVGVLMAFKGFGVWSLVGLNLAQAASFSLFLWLFYKWRPKLIFDKSIFKYHFDYGYKLTLSSILNTIYINLYKVIIGKRFSTTSVGYFTQADSLRLFPVNQLSSILNRVAFPLFASIKNDDARLKKAYISSTRLVLSFSSVLMIMLILIAKPLFLVVFGEKWISSVPYFQILCIASVFLPLGTYNLNILKVKGRTDLFLRVELIKKIIGVVFLLVCIPFGINAIVWSLCITNIFFAYLNGYFSGKLINYSIHQQILHSFNVILISVIPYALTYVANEFWFYKFNNYISILFNISVYTIFYLPLMLIFNKALLNDIKMILKR